MKGLDILRLAGWLIILGGVAVSAVRIVVLLGQQAFTEVAGAGVPALVGLAAGALVLTLASGIAGIQAKARTPKSAGLPRPANAGAWMVKVMGILIAVFGGVEMVGAARSTLADPAGAAFVWLAILPSLAIVAIGLGILIAGAAIGRR
ncbi:MAG: hypothetical protein ACM3Q1_13230 [Bacteroidales bacterium]